MLYFLFCQLRALSFYNANNCARWIICGSAWRILDMYKVHTFFFIFCIAVTRNSDLFLPRALSFGFLSLSLLRLHCYHFKTIKCALNLIRLSGIQLK